MKLQSVVEQIADLVSEVCGFPAESNQAAIDRDVLHRWSQNNKLVKEVLKPSMLQIQLLRTFDLKFSHRRIRFVIQRINRYYPTSGKTGQPTTTELDFAKDQLYKMESRLAAGPHISEELSRTIKDFFDPARLEQTLKLSEADEAVSKEFASCLDEIKDALGRSLDEQFSEFRSDLFQVFETVTLNWQPEVKEELLLRYLGFPFWDVLIFPLRYLSDVGELDKIEVTRVSPLDACKLKAPAGGAKLEGIGLYHFAAFFEQTRRENDYLWGRLDAAERLIGMLLGDGELPYYRHAFEAILKEEAPILKKVGSLMDDLNGQVAKL